MILSVIHLQAATPLATRRSDWGDDGCVARPIGSSQRRQFHASPKAHLAVNQKCEPEEKLVVLESCASANLLGGDHSGDSGKATLFGSVELVEQSIIRMFGRVALSLLMVQD